MSNNEAIKMLKARLECVINLSEDKCSYSSCADCHLCCEQGSLEKQKEYLDMAIKSLEVWEKVRAEIENLYEYTSREDYIHQEETRAFIDKSEVLEIIDKHLSEVSE